VDSLRAAGAEPVIADALDAEALADAVVLARPDLVIHQLTSLPPTPDPRRHAAAYAQTARLRTQGTRNLLRAATAAGVRRVIAQSIAFGYAPDDGPASEAAALPTKGPKDLLDTIAAAADLERRVRNATGLQGVVLRYGHLYRPDTWYAPDGPIGQQIRKRRFPIVGDGMGCFSFVHVADAAIATVAALGSAAAGVYNVVDDEPAPLRVWLPWYAKTPGAPPPRHIPATLPASPPAAKPRTSAPASAAPATPKPANALAGSPATEAGELGSPHRQPRQQPRRTGPVKLGCPRTARVGGEHLAA
jgi:2-alkyl-3-oxoalkanoate reductase